MIQIIIMVSLSTMACKKIDDRDDVVLKCYQSARKIGLHRVFARQTSVASVFKPYVQRFEQRYGGSIGDISIRFDTVSTFALCRFSTLGTKTIMVNKEQWDRFEHVPDGKAKRDILLSHELGHCVLEIFDHRNDRIDAPSNQHTTGLSTTYPSSLMAAYLSTKDLEAILRNQEAYFAELFKNIPVASKGQLQ